MLDLLDLDQKTLKDIEKNNKIKQLIIDCLNQQQNKLNKSQSNLIYKLCTNTNSYVNPFINKISQYILDNKILKNINLDKAIEYYTTQQQDNNVNFDEFIGVGVEVSQSEIVQIVEKFIQDQKEYFQTERYNFKMQDQLANLKKLSVFADPGLMTKEFKTQIEKFLGPKTKEDEQKQNKKPPKKQEEKKDDKNKIADLVGRDMKESNNSKEQLQIKLDKFGPGVYTRFPPEPNGYLHIGHLKAMRFDFITAEQNNGKCYLRYDDTNPDKECHEYIDSILENIKWMGFKPFQITYSSNYFDQIFEKAIKLIKDGNAYVCFQTKDQMSKNRQEGINSPHRDKSVQENIELFNQMKEGKFKEGEAMLRLKLDMKHPNMTMRDPVIYRIKDKPHPRTGDKWKIYPMYDFTHPLCDSLEGITHSLCTLEFEIRRELYYKILDLLNMYKPMVWEFSRLNIEYALTSKRKIQYLIENKYVNGWDDPRLFTVNGIIRKGYPREALLDFCQQVSVTRSGNENVIELHNLENTIRKHLDQSCVRSLAVIDPVQLIIEDAEMEFFDAPEFPNQKESKTYKINIEKNIFVEKNDVRMDKCDKFFGFMPDQIVGLRYAYVVKCKEIKKEGDSFIVICEKYKGTEKPKTFLNWISQTDSVNCEIRLYNQLFKTNLPNQLKEEEIAKNLNPNALEIQQGKMNKQMTEKEVGFKCQFERQGFFCVDKDSTKDKFVWNQIVPLYQTKLKKANNQINK